MSWVHAHDAGASPIPHSSSMLPLWKGRGDLTLCLPSRIAAPSARNPPSVQSRPVFRPRDPPGSDTRGGWVGVG